jgi:hypothetical protein
VLSQARQAILVFRMAMLLKHCLADSLMAFLCLETANRVDQVDLKAVLATVPTRNVLGVLELFALTLSLSELLLVVLAFAPLVLNFNLRLDLLVVFALPFILNLSFGVVALDFRPTLAFMIGFLALALTLILGIFFIFWSLLVESFAALLTNLTSRLEMSLPIGATLLETDQNMAEILFMAPWVKVVLHLVIELLVQQAEVIDGHI